MQPANAPQYQGRDAQLASYRDSPQVRYEATGSHIVPAASGDMAYEVGTTRLTFETPGGPVATDWKYLVVWRKIGGEWLVGANSFSMDVLPPQG